VASAYSNAVRAMRTLPDIGPLMERMKARRQMDAELEREWARYGGM